MPLGSTLWTTAVARSGRGAGFTLCPFCLTADKWQTQFSNIPTFRGILTPLPHGHLYCATQAKRRACFPEYCKRYDCRASFPDFWKRQGMSRGGYHLHTYAFMASWRGQLSHTHAIRVSLPMSLPPGPASLCSLSKVQGLLCCHWTRFTECYNQ